VPGASQSREKDETLSLAARLGLYAMLAGLVVASFTVVPGRRAPVMAAPTVESELAAARVAHLSRGLAPALRTVDGFELSVFELPEPLPITLLVEAHPEPLPEPSTEPTPEPKPEATPEPEPEAALEPEPAATPQPKPEPPPPPAPRPVPGPVGALTNATTLWAEGRMLELMNASRVRAGLVPLVMDIRVGDTARAHSAAEARVRYVYHDGPDGTSASRNVPACGTGWYGENTGKIWRDNVDALHIEFMNEPWEPINHRTNIMDPLFRRVGVGAVMGPDAMYMTMVFCR
jgi:uncharacterized protein YkwD